MFTYTYDEVGNITAIRINNVLKYSYEHDDLGQLVRENNAVTNRTYAYTYDNAGNITSRKVYAYTAASTITGEPLYTNTYGYSASSGWGDKLMSYSGGTFSYDSIGNPISYYNGLRYTFVWTNGIQLARASVSGYVLTFTYNDSGIRTSKTVNGVTHEYHLAGSQILSEEWTEANGVQHLIVYHYDANGLPIGMSYRNSDYTHYECDTFLYVKNLQGDIIKVLDEEGDLLVSYTYDAWGNPTSVTYSNGEASTAVIYNPFRYRGYYYDAELGFYYLNSRYYDPSIGRFINADGLVSTGQGLLGYNMYAYCNNNPIIYSDLSGEIAGWAVVVIVIVAIVVITAIDHHVAKRDEDGYCQAIPDIDGNAINDKMLYISGNGFEADENAVTLFDTEAGVYSGVAETEHGEFSLATFLSAKATAALNYSEDNLKVEASGYASIYTAFGDFGFNFGGSDITISVALHVGAVGGGVIADLKNQKYGFTPFSAGIIPSFTIEVGNANKKPHYPLRRKIGNE